MLAACVSVTRWLHATKQQVQKLRFYSSEEVEPSGVQNGCAWAISKKTEADKFRLDVQQHSNHIHVLLALIQALAIFSLSNLEAVSDHGSERKQKM